MLVKLKKSSSKIKSHETSHRIVKSQCHLFYSSKTTQAAFTNVKAVFYRKNAGILLSPALFSNEFPFKSSLTYSFVFHKPC